MNNFPVYLLTNYIQNWINASSFDPVIQLDYLIPFLPFTIWIYYIFYLLFFFMLFFIPNNKKGEKLLRNMLISLIIDIITSSVIFLLFPVKVKLRENINYQNINSFYTKQLILLLYKYDKPFSSWPSLHVSQTIIMYKYFNKIYQSHAVTFLVVLIILSTLTTKQHYLFDIVTGIMKGYVFTY